MTRPNEHLAALDRFEVTGLDELERIASLQSRTDRKYLLPAHRGVELLHALRGDLLVLRIDGARSFRYDTVYFDTPDLDAYLSTAHRRRHRFKIRIRTYTGSARCMLEVKRKGGRGQTVKLRSPHPIVAASMLTPEAAGFIDDALGRPGLARRLRPVLTTSFERATLLDRLDGSRATLDREVTLALPEDDQSVVLREHSILETKSVGAATLADRWLWIHGHRPTAFSKFCIGMALQHAELPANKWNRTLRRDLGWRPRCEHPLRQRTSSPIDGARTAVMAASSV
jgi:hypothetical protein